MLERTLEDNLIEILTTGVSQWTYRPDIKTEEDLWKNLREKLTQQNLSVLDGHPITDLEMVQIKNYLLDQAMTTYKAACWLYGENRIAQIPLVREDASLGKIDLKAINNREIAGGTSSYEVINQYVPTGGDRNRRFDVTLLINGLPLIHIELKNQDHPFMDAFRQIQKYADEGQFQGLFGFIQMFVVSNGAQTRYIAANSNGELNQRFLIRWVDEENQPVEDYLTFAKQVLNIPAAHLMVGNYSVIDDEKHQLILLRPYQIHAISKVRLASRVRDSGFVWHTTGSGKTLTSYTVTKNLLDIPSVDKTIFLIDRKDLDQKTTEDFLSYAKHDSVDILETESTVDLERKLSNNDRVAIVTTIQKLQRILRRLSTKELVPKLEKLKKQIQSKRIVFVVDECHRAVAPQTKREIERFFQSPRYSSLWYGFTGTPIFQENQRMSLGDTARTTKEQYGECLHRYTIKEALKDQSVLGFQIQTLGRSADTFRQLALKMGLYTEETVDNVTPAQLERQVITAYEKNGKPFYANDEHRLHVIDYIVNKSEAKLGLNNSRGIGYAYEGILTCSSIKEAQRYYQLIQEFVKTGKVKESIRQKLPDFPKVAITYTVGENEDGAMANQKLMKQALDDYNAMFGTEFSLEDINSYNSDLNERLMRKRAKYADRDQQLDLVIVVDRLLTGFDAPCLSTIFIDRPPMKPQHLIQAFSRTNRLYDQGKRYGQVVTMQYPASYAEAIDNALLLYSNGGTDEVSAPVWEEAKRQFEEAADQLKKLQIDPLTPPEFREDNREEISNFVRAFQAVDRTLASLKVYDEYQEEPVNDVIGLNQEKLDRYCAVYKNAVDWLRTANPDPDIKKPPLPDIDYQLESVRGIEVNYKYVVALIQSHVLTDEDVEPKPISKASEEKVLKYIKLYSQNNPVLGEILNNIWFEINLNQESFRGKDILVEIHGRIRQIRDEKICAFSKEWGISPNQVRGEFEAWNGQDDILITGDYEKYIDSGHAGTKLQYRRELRKAIKKLFQGELQPLTRF